MSDAGTSSSSRRPHRISLTEQVEGPPRAALTLFDAIYSRPPKHRFSYAGLQAYFWYFRKDWRCFVQATAFFFLMGLPFFEAPCRDWDAPLPNNLRSCPTGRTAAMVEGFFLLPVIVFDWLLRCYAQGYTSVWQGRWNKLMFVAVALNVLDLILATTLGEVWEPRVLRLVRAVYVAQSSSASRMAVVEAIKTIKSTLCVVAGLFVFILVWTNVGFPLLRTDAYFLNYYDAFMNMHTLVTTANFPDVMLPAYRVSPIYSLYFIIFVIMALYFGLASVLATVAATYRDMMADRIIRLEMLRREGIANCFTSIDEDKSGLIDKGEFVEVYVELEKYLRHKPFCCLRRRAEVERAAQKGLDQARREALEIFDKVDADGGGALDADEFQAVGNCVIDFHRPKPDVDDPLSGSWLCKACRAVREHQAYGWCIAALGLASLGIQARYMEMLFNNMPYSGMFAVLWWADWVMYFMCVGDVLITMRCRENVLIFFKDPVNVFEIVALLVVFWVKVWASLLLGKQPVDVPLLPALEAGKHESPFRTLLSVRAAHNMRLFYTIPQTRTMLNAFALIGPDLLHLVVNLLLVYQVFGTIGSSAFNGVLSSDNAKLHGSLYDLSGYYDFVNFDSWRQSTQSLFYLMVVNNWFLTARAAALALGTTAPVIYFILFWVVCVVMVLNLIIAMFIEMYRFYLSKAGGASNRHTLKDMFTSDISLRNSTDRPLKSFVSHSSTDIIGSSPPGGQSIRNMPEKPAEEDPPAKDPLAVPPSADMPPVSLPHAQLCRMLSGEIGEAISSFGVL